MISTQKIIKMGGCFGVGVKRVYLGSYDGLKTLFVGTGKSSKFGCFVGRGDPR